MRTAEKILQGVEADLTHAQASARLLKSQLGDSYDSIAELEAKRRALQVGEASGCAIRRGLAEICGGRVRRTFSKLPQLLPLVAVQRELEVTKAALSLERKMRLTQHELRVAVRPLAYSQ